MHWKRAHLGKRGFSRGHFHQFWFGDGADESGGSRRRGRRGGRGGGRGGPLGGRRPLRYLARQLDLDDEQFGALSALFSQLKTERAQAAVDRRRAAALYADALSSETFDKDAATQAAAIRAATQKRMSEFWASSLGALHELLDEGQRKKLANLLREMPLGAL